MEDIQQQKSVVEKEVDLEENVEEELHNVVLVPTSTIIKNPKNIKMDDIQLQKSVVEKEVDIEETVEEESETELNASILSIVLMDTYDDGNYVSADFVGICDDQACAIEINEKLTKHEKHATNIVVESEEEGLRKQLKELNDQKEKHAKKAVSISKRLLNLAENKREAAKKIADKKKEEDEVRKRKFKPEVDARQRYNDSLKLALAASILEGELQNAGRIMDQVVKKQYETYKTAVKNTMYLNDTCVKYKQYWLDAKAARKIQDNTMKQKAEREAHWSVLEAAKKAEEEYHSNENQ